ncbi:hypothetical protein QEN19_000195 [Hanseniaspora menglaensis]
MLRSIFNNKAGITVFTNKTLKSKSPLYTLLTTKFNNPSKDEEHIPIDVNNNFPTKDEWSYIRKSCNRSLNVFKGDDLYGISDVIKTESELEPHLGEKQDIPKKDAKIYHWDGELWVDWENKKYGVYKFSKQDIDF